MSNLAATPAPTALSTNPALGERLPLDQFDATLRLVRGTDLTDSEIARVIELLREAFNGGPGWFALPVPEADHLRWKLGDFPFESYAYLVEDRDDRVVGFGARLYRRWMVHGSIRVGRDGVESAIHPSLQGSGLYRARRERLGTFDGAEDFRISFGSHPASLGSRESRGVLPVGNPLDNLVRPLRVGRYVQPARAPRPSSSRTRIAIEGGQRRLPRPLVVRRLAWHARMLRHRLKHAPLRFAQPDWTIRTVSRFDSNINPFFERASRAFDLVQWRDEHTLNWRYADRRAGPFTIRVAESEGRIVGYAVTRATEVGAALADLLVLPGREDVAYALIQDAAQLAKRAGASAIRSWMIENHPYHRLLLHSGFIPIRRIVKPGYQDMHGTSNYGFLSQPHARIHLMLGDTDHI